MEQLVVRLGSVAQDPVHWLVWSTAEDDIIASGELPDAHALESLSERAGQRPVLVLVPATDVLLKWVTLPPKAGRKALAAIPFMLEDDITGDISDQVFLNGPRHGDQQAVAIVTRQKLVDWKAMMDAAGLFCDKMIPDILAVPVQPEQWSLMTLNDTLLVRQDEWQGLQGNPAWVLPAIAHFTKQRETPLVIAKYSDIHLTDVTNMEEQQQDLEVPMLHLAKGAIRQSFNMLQGEFKTKRKSNSQWRQWQLAAGLAAVALLLTLIDKGLQLNQINSEKAQLQAQIETEFKRAFPDIRRIVNVRSQMRQRMSGLEQGGGNASLLVVMSQLSDAFSSSQVKPQTLRFDAARSELRMQAVANNFEAIEQFKRLAEERGFEVEQGAINNRDDQVISSLSIRS